MRRCLDASRVAAGQSKLLAASVVFLRAQRDDLVRRCIQEWTIAPFFSNSFQLATASPTFSASPHARPTGPRTPGGPSGLGPLASLVHHPGSGQVLR